MISVSFALRELEIGSCGTVVDWNHYLREVCAEKLLRNPVRIGGEGKHVEIDESVFVRSKQNVGRAVTSNGCSGAFAGKRESVSSTLSLTDQRIPSFRL